MFSPPSKNHDNWFEMDVRERGEDTQIRQHNWEAACDQYENCHYSNRVHSLHRNKAFKTNNELLMGYDARIGGSGVRTLGRNKSKSKRLIVTWKCLVYLLSPNIKNTTFG